MAIEIPRKLVDYVLLGPPDARRQLQDSPVLGDVWSAFAQQPEQARDLLITPDRKHTASDVAVALERSLRRKSGSDPNIAFLQGVVAARLYFREVLAVVVPMTHWWHSKRIQTELENYLDPDEGPERLNRAVNALLLVLTSSGDKDPSVPAEQFSAFDRLIALAGVVLWAGTVKDNPARRGGKKAKAAEPLTFDDAVKTMKIQTIADLLVDLLDEMMLPDRGDSLIFQISLNRSVSPAVARSVPAVKGDAARTLFAVRCKEIAWAVIDSGIDRTHPAFLDDAGKESRVRKCFDFTQIRRIISLSNSRPAIREKNLEEILEHRRSASEDISELRSKWKVSLATLADDAINQRLINWSLVEEMISLSNDEPPPSNHGTHVAGIIGANSRAQKNGDISNDECADGMCPDINLYDFRVLAPTLLDTEFAIIAALQYIRYMNQRHRYTIIHGTNLSLSIPHDVRNYACGRTPICLECEQLVESGVVVVAAAGNRGYQSFETKEGAYEGYAALSLTDPGNAESVITVGATHRHAPHMYGVSFFSSRGPTGDGRPKPDLLAPGERICGPLPGSQWGDLDGTSMAAPHVSGAAAMLMARYTELIGQPRRIKRILCESATDLGRERSFQGHGMLDVLRAFQNV